MAWRVSVIVCVMCRIMCRCEVVGSGGENVNVVSCLWCVGGGDAVVWFEGAGYDFT